MTSWTQGISQLPVLDDQGQLVGLLTEDNLIRGLSSTLDASAPVRSLMERSVPTVEFNTPISSLQGTILKSGLAIVLDGKKQPSHILTKIDLVEWMSKQK